jgi:hypothetical protein
VQILRCFSWIFFFFWLRTFACETLNNPFSMSWKALASRIFHKDRVDFFEMGAVMAQCKDGSSEGKTMYNEHDGELCGALGELFLERPCRGSITQQTASHYVLCGGCQGIAVCLSTLKYWVPEEAQFTL